MKITKINGREFDVIGNNEFQMLRESEKNRSDFAGSSALAMHKAIIGICGLNALEDAEKIGIELRPSKAIQTYYIIYHLFTCCMLLDNEYKVIFKGNKRGELKYGVELKKLRQQAKTAREWNERKKFESDLAVRISHSDIKIYCREIREKKHNKFVNEALNKAFVKGECVLFEEADYIRDRSIYRPSHVPSFTDTPIQTSKNVRSQIESLPNSEELFRILNEIHMEFCAIASESKLKRDYCYNFCYGLVDCKTKYVSELGYTWDDLEKMGGNQKEEYVPSFVAQAMELFTAERLITFYERYWSSLIQKTREYI